LTLPPQRSYWRWDILGIPARNALLLLQPYLILKNRQAQLAIDLCEMIMARGGTSRRLTPEEISIRAAMYLDIRKLNQRGIHAAITSS